jgi:cell envelope-related function transcriptional attenuator common domain
MKKESSRKKSIYKKFFSIVFCMVGIFILLSVFAILSYKFFAGGNNNISNEQNKSNTIINKIFLPPKKTKFLVLGLDQNETLSDSMFIGCFDRDTQEINVISIPRDTYIKMSAQTIKELRDLGRRPPSSGIMKINAVHSYAGKEHGNEYAQKQVEELLNIKLDYYIAVNITAFKKVVDTVGGIYMDVPMDLNYDDPTQNLHIHIPKGRQLLNGDMAEGVVRFRKGYKRADLQRIEVQQQFMKEFFTQVLNKKTILNNLTSLLKTFLQEVQTNFGIEDLPKYIRYINKLNSDSITFYTLPGVPKMIDGASYFLNDKEETTKLIDEIFYSSSNKNKNSNPQYKIQILNGSDIDGLAKEKKELLEKNNFEVLDTGNYTGKKTYDTRIMVKEKGMGQDLKKYFNNAKIEVDETISDDYNIIIITGLGEKK